MIPPRAAGSRKGENGRVLVLGGSRIYHGAPVLASLAALRSGTDLVYAAVPGMIADPVRALSPDLIVIPLADQKLTRGAAAKLLGALPVVDSAAVGMGMPSPDRGALARLVRDLADRDVRTCLDAGALVPEVLDAAGGTCSVVTPHAGEFRRLFGEDPGSGEARERAVLGCARRHGVTVLLKGAEDVISDGESVLCCRGGSPAMTAGGTGDVLAGLVAGLLSRCRRPLDAAAAAACINAAAGESVHARLGFHMAASDLVAELPAVMAPLDRVS
ncbi:MAG: NAD(P)H-hydrate dehydratase [Nitrosopumilus sp.]|nr:NAD(P)H-hydrate dehydratase [Nitrosopumilus sp.]MDA7940807.1 NAD(P)H-hydrate dehydratase [Nitrosopumilus sp.]MDA7943015.1 NAD(P)H-hydrate dehydratase [Nitrosopumilus sp.]MDA7944574.1 NAD(P)H-hydrate dehydratase [Nitrosopumilus sp.]MDA7952263.1 NAD(P)H-hydrate dehydratase [Nitrosopumilus sp.]